MAKRQKAKFSTVDEYIALQPEHKRAGLVLLRKTIRSAAPKAKEVISYQKPGYYFHGMLVWFKAFRNEYGLQVKAEFAKVIKEKFKDYKRAKGTVRFPMNKPLPLDLITEVVKYCVDVNLHNIVIKDLLQSKRIKK